MMTKRTLFILVLAMGLALALPSMAMANFAIHGNYAEDTDACAGCHRAHTSVSTITWTNTADPAEQRSALLVTTATTMQEFCYACHDATGQGANTNVEQGVYESDTGDPTDPNVIGGDLNGGGFEEFQGMSVTSTHVTNGSSWGAYGGGYYGQADVGADGQNPEANLGETVPIVMDCATCHDVHGTSNYRLLKSVVFGNTVGGYVPSADPQDPHPNAWVQSVEEGWPDGGFRLSTPYPNYKPNYTAARYAKGYDVVDGVTGAINDAKGMSGWCAGCHATYINDSGNSDNEFAAYNAGDGMGFLVRHRHPVNTEMANYLGPDASNMIIETQQLPLGHDLSETVTGADAPDNADTDWVDCMSCHRAHGTSAAMEGWANEKADFENDEIPSFIANSGTGVPSALLRLDNRGVCQSCHNK